MLQNQLPPTGNGSQQDKPATVSATPQYNRGGGKWRGTGVPNPVQPGETPGQIVNQPIPKHPGRA